MSYDFRLCMPKPGQAPEGIALADSSELGGGDIEPEKEATKQRLAEALIASNPALTPFAFGFEEIARSQQISVDDAMKKYRHIELNGPEDGNGIQITLFDNEVTVTVPYWHQGEKARRVFDEIWSYLALLQSEGGYFTYDPQIERVLNLRSDFEKVLNCYLQVSGGIAKEFSIKTTKRWWEFWK